MDYYWCVQSAVCVECEIGKKLEGAEGMLCTPLTRGLGRCIFMVYIVYYSIST